MIKIKLVERFAIVAWAILILYLFTIFRSQKYPKGMVGTLLETFFSSLTAGYLQ